LLSDRGENWDADVTTKHKNRPTKMNAKKKSTLATKKRFQSLYRTTKAVCSRHRVNTEPTRRWEVRGRRFFNKRKLMRSS